MKIRQEILMGLGRLYYSEVLCYGTSQVLKAVQDLVKLKDF